MKNKLKKTLLLLTAAVCFLPFLPHETALNYASAEAPDGRPGKPVPVVSYETKSDYDFSGLAPVSNMSYGKRAAGSLRIKGDFNADTGYNNVPAYGIEQGTLTVSYDYDGFLLDSNGDYYIESDERLFGDSVQKGRLEIQKSATGIEWKSAAKPVLNFFEANSGGNDDLYTISGGDLAKGMFFRVIISYETKKSSGSKIKPDSSTYHVEVYEFFACYNNGNISLHDLGRSIDAVNGASDTGYTAEQIEKGETIKDGGTTVKGFSIDTLGAAYTVKVNGKNASNGDSFTKNGRYDIEVKTKLGKETSMTVYVFDGGSDKGRSTYFEDYLVTEKRIFREGYDLVFARDAVMKLKATGESVPPLTGTVKENISGKTVLTLDPDTVMEGTKTKANDRSSKSFTLAPGEYTAELYSGDNSSGSFFHYTYRFTVLDESPAPYVNKANIDGFKRQEDFKPKHYEVAYETTGGGSIYVCFDCGSKGEAYRYAYDIEKRFIEKSYNKETGSWEILYKGVSNQKEPYPAATKEDKLALTKLLCDNAEKNVETAYFDPTADDTTKTLKTVDKPIEDMTERESIRLFSDEEQRQKLKADGLPVLNGYTFMKIGNGDIDAKTITAESEKLDEPLELEAGTSVDKQHLPSAVITISEKNKYGDVNAYDVIYLAGNTTAVTLRAVNGGKETMYKLVPGEDQELTADAVSFAEIANELDKWAIVKVESDVYPSENRLICYAKELEGLALYRKGNYRVTFIDRAGHKYSLTIKITGSAGYDDVRTNDSKTYSEIFNAVHEVKKMEEEDR